MSPQPKIPVTQLAPGESVGAGDWVTVMLGCGVPPLPKRGGGAVGVRVGDGALVGVTLGWGVAPLPKRGGGAVGIRVIPGVGVTLMATEPPVAAIPQAVVLCTGLTIYAPLGHCRQVLPINPKNPVLQRSPTAKLGAVVGVGSGGGVTVGRGVPVGRGVEVGVGVRVGDGVAPPNRQKPSSESWQTGVGVGLGVMVVVGVLVGIRVKVAGGVGIRVGVVTEMAPSLRRHSVRQRTASEPVVPRHCARQLVSGVGVGVNLGVGVSEAANCRFSAATHSGKVA